MPPDPPATIPTEGPCHPWVDIDTVRARCSDVVDEMTNEALDFGIRLASNVLWTATGRRYGLCERTYFPCWVPCQMKSTCSCRLPELVLPGPIASVIEIMVNGVPMDLTVVGILKPNRRVLIRWDDEYWPCCNSAPEVDPTVVPAETPYTDAWQVKTYQGRAVPQLGIDAAAILAEQAARQFCRTPGCDESMSPSLKRVSRRGVTKEFDADVERDEDGRIRTGIRVVDNWILSVNPHGRVRQSAILRGDDPLRNNLWRIVEAA